MTLSELLASFMESPLVVWVSEEAEEEVLGFTSSSGASDFISQNTTSVTFVSVSKISNEPFE